MEGVPTELRIIRARQQSLPEINSLIARSKSYWPWPEEYLKAALPLLALTSVYIQTNHCFEVLDAREKLVAFFSVVVRDARLMLDNLWVTPERIGHGIGRRACEHVLRLAREQGWTEVWVLPDPMAEGFYRKMGFSDTGERVASRVPGGPVFSKFRIHLR